MTGTLTVAATPIGNPGDASARLTSALAEAELIAAEDTRRLRRLAAELGVQVAARIVSLFEGNEARRTQELLVRLQSGEDVLLVSDAGMPTVSDPGYRLVAACAKAGVDVTVIPGPSAVLAALAVSGLPTDRFTFEGFLPRKRGPRTKRISELVESELTLVFFESPRRLRETLADLAMELGGTRNAAVCRELTKTHEEVRRGSLSELVEWADSGVLGEIVVVVAGLDPAESATDSDVWAAEVERLVAAGLTRRSAVDEVALRKGVSRRVVFDAIGSRHSEPRISSGNPTT